MKIKAKYKSVSFLLATIISVSFLSPVGAYAATPVFGKKYTNGVGNIAVWLDHGSGVGYWSSYIANAANNWMYSGWSNPILYEFCE